MPQNTPSHTAAHQAALETLLRRQDVWRGDSARFVPQAASSTGHPALDKALLHKGWPLGTLVEVCQPQCTGYSEWHLFTPALGHMTNGYAVLLNPPAEPFAQAMLQAGVDLDQLLLVNAAERSAFLQSFLELARAPACHILLAWQPRQSLSYTDLRKCLLAGGQDQGLNVLFRHQQVQSQSSPASLRLAVQWQEKGLAVTVLKQKGRLAARGQTVLLPLPAHAQPGQSKPILNTNTPGEDALPR